jgi:hypothetical protein
MPAINPSLLKRQISAALAHKDDLELYVRGLQEIVEFYADRTRRSTKASETLIFGKVLRVPKPVLQAVTRAIHADPDLSLLWGRNYRETRMIAISLLSVVDLPMITERFENWAEACDDDEVLLWMANEGLMLGKRPLESIPWKTLNMWLRHPSPQIQRLSLFSLLDLVAGHSDDGHLPRVFRLLRGSSDRMHSASQGELQDLLCELAVRSPQETVQFLLDEFMDVPDFRRLIQKCIEVLPTGLQDELRRLL